MINKIKNAIISFLDIPYSLIKSLFAKTTEKVSIVYQNSLKFQIDAGSSKQLGATVQKEGINFALFSKHATRVTLCLFSPGAKKAFAEIPLTPGRHRTNHVWHALIKGLPSSQIEYGYKLSGPTEGFNPDKIVSDPYAKALTTGHIWGKRPTVNYCPRGKVIADTPFNWEGDKHPHVPLDKLLIYEMNARSFTKAPSSKTNEPGTFDALIEKIPHLKRLGINAVELMPVFEFDECEIEQKNPKTNATLHNAWGYSTLNFFSIMNRYSKNEGWTAGIDSFKRLVKALHKEGIEVILDVVYNHTAEGRKEGPTYSFKGIDKPSYYIHDSEGNFLDFTGTGNTFNAGHPAGTALILDSMRYFVKEMHVDGFRFDLASCLTRDEKGNPLPNPPLMKAIVNDPTFAHTKLIAEAWDCAGLYQVGSFPGEGRFAEWNDNYRNSVRKFLKGKEGEVGNFATALCGSQPLYGKDRAPCHSINFITAHDGFSLHDLVSYNQKHNLENGENNQDGANDNESWNCGHEGATHDPHILRLRERQMRNFHAALMVSIGTPMVLMGDEYTHTRKGNNNPYCQDNDLNWFQWKELEKNAPFFEFYKKMIQFRKDHPLLQRSEFLKDEDVDWHGTKPFQSKWDDSNKFLAYTLKDLKQENHLYIAFNAHDEELELELPPPPQNKKWVLCLDTNAPESFIASRTKELPSSYKMVEHSTLIAKAI